MDHIIARRATGLRQETKLRSKRTGIGNTGSVSKRITDLVIASIGAVLSAPILLLAIIAIVIEDPGPVLYLQNRSTRYGRIFKIFKLRTMVRNADTIGPALTQKHDPRVTRVGRFLRRTSIDELPQVFNVLRGEMSIVGPRPEVPAVTDSYDDELREVLRFKPGITGISQINGRAALNTYPKIRMEIDYHRNATWVSDVMIMLKTPKALLSNEGNVM